MEIKSKLTGKAIYKDESAVSLKAVFSQIYNDQLRPDLSDALLAEADIEDGIMMSLKFDGASFRDSHLVNTHWGSCSLRGASFVRADLRGANFFKADLRGADFTDARLDGANFFKARLDKATVIDADCGARNLKVSRN